MLTRGTLQRYVKAASHKRFIILSHCLARVGTMLSDPSISDLMSRVEKSRLNPFIFESRGSPRFRDAFKREILDMVKNGGISLLYSFSFFFFLRERGRKAGKFSSAISHSPPFYISRVLLLLILLVRRKSAPSGRGDICRATTEKSIPRIWKRQEKKKKKKLSFAPRRRNIRIIVRDWPRSTGGYPQASNAQRLSRR